VVLYKHVDIVDTATHFSACKSQSFFLFWRVELSFHWALRPLASTALGWGLMAIRVINCLLDAKKPHSAQALPEIEAGHGG
jgi:hypothetical protein